MKFTLAAFVGIVAATPTSLTYGSVADAPVWSLRSVNDHSTDAGLQRDFGDHATSQANARQPLRSHVELDESSSSSDSSSSKSSDSSSSSGDDKKVQLDDDEEVDHSNEFFKSGE